VALVIQHAPRSLGALLCFSDAHLELHDGKPALLDHPILRRGTLLCDGAAERSLAPLFLHRLLRCFQSPL
jgi:hypothetical protein